MPIGYKKQPKEIPDRLWNMLKGKGDPECKDCGGDIVMTDVEGQYSGQCLACRDRYPMRGDGMAQHYRKNGDDGT